jgi:hypothetical protein
VDLLLPTGSLIAFISFKTTTSSNGGIRSGQTRDGEGTVIEVKCGVCHARFPSEGVSMWRPERFGGNWSVVEAGDALVGYPWRGREQMETSTGDN